MRNVVLLALVAASGCSSSEGVAPDEDAALEATADDGVDASPTDGSIEGAIDTGSPVDAPPDTTPPPADASPTGGCGKAATAGVSNGTISVGGVTRTYVLSIPTGYDPKKALPLAFGWHGRTGDGKGFRGYSGVEKAAANAAIFVYPDGLTVTPSNPKDTGWDLAAKGRDIAFFDALVTKLSGDLCVDDKRIFSFGFSFGGYMSNAVGCARPKVVRAGIKARDLWAKAAGCDTSSSTKVAPDPCVTYAGCGATTPVRWCQAATGGHSWPSYAPAGIWGFFSGL
ncbi:MAG: hypothetical protein IPJ34_36585 [Myxococcales bacterium]|nr:hypothetical protein [Myxococcales bacterium]